MSNDGFAFRHVIPGKAEESRVPDEYSTFVLPAGTTVWYHDLSGHYESAYQKKDIQEVGSGGMGRAACDLQTCRPRRLRRDHRGESGRLRRDGARSGRAARLCDGTRPPAAAQLAVRASLRS